VFTVIGSFLAVLILTIVFMKMYKTRQQHKAASNIVFAKYTHSKLTGKQQKDVQEKAKELVLNSNIKMTGFANEVERFGWYALAMNDLGISSKVPENPAWYPVKNPYVAIMPDSYLIDAVCNSIKQSYGIDVNVSAKRNY